MRWIILVVSLALAACGPDEHKTNTTYAERCTPAGFTATQCKFLKRMEHKAKSASDNASTMAGAAMGLSAGAKR